MDINLENWKLFLVKIIFINIIIYNANGYLLCKIYDLIKYDYNEYNLISPDVLQLHVIMDFDFFISGSTINDMKTVVFF